MREEVLQARHQRALEAEQEGKARSEGQDGQEGQGHPHVGRSLMSMLIGMLVPGLTGEGEEP